MLWEVAVVADHDADVDAEGRLPDGEAEVAGLEVVLLVPDERGGLHQGNAGFPVLAHDLAVRAEHDRRVVQLALHRLFVDRRHERDLVLGGEL